jgi:divalent metal cation (Fe/Co/Zn/Cd) transporter
MLPSRDFGPPKPSRRGPPKRSHAPSAARLAHSDVTMFIVKWIVRYKEKFAIETEDNPLNDWSWLAKSDSTTCGGSTLPLHLTASLYSTVAATN